VISNAIVVPLDGSSFAERAVPVAAELATRLGTRLVLMTTAWLDFDRPPDDYLRDLATTVRGIEVESVVLHELHPPTAVRAVVADRPGSMVCMTTHGRGGIRWAVLGSVAEELLAISPDPVLLVGPRCALTWTSSREGILLCHDGSPTTEIVVDAACDFAHALDQQVWIATVIHPLDVEDAERPQHLFTDVEAMIAKRGLEPHATLLRSSYPAGAIVDASEDLPASLIAMATHTRTGVARVAVGSVTMGVLNLAPCPVLARSTHQVGSTPSGPKSSA
jgi:nucleotide-binding universal stress UspA family protein